MTITEISKQKNKENRVNVSIDNEYYCSLDILTVMNFKLKKGRELSAEEISEIILFDQKEKALAYAFDYAASAFKTERQVKEKLCKKGYDKIVINFVLNKLKEYKYINDVAFAKQYTQTKKKGKGRKLIEYELKLKGIDYECNISDEEEFENCMELLIKYMNNKVFDYNKCARYLYSKGFTYDTIKCVLEEYCNSDRD